MEKQLTKKLYAFIITTMMFSASVKAQSFKPVSNPELTATINCHCTVGGGFTGCGFNSACKFYCRAYCRQHHPLSGDSGSDFSDAAFLTEVVSSPVSNSTTISFFLDQPKKVSLCVFDLNGRLVKTIADKAYETGEHSLSWNSNDEKGNKIAAGVYALKTEAGEETETQKIIVQ